MKEINIVKGRELFIDHYLIDRLDGVSMVLHHPYDEGPVLKFDESWEGPFCGYCTVIKDGTLYRLYYRGLPEAGQDGSNLGNPHCPRAIIQKEPVWIAHPLRG